jgi:hypothetical protein
MPRIFAKHGATSMQSRREFLEMLPAGLVGAGCVRSLEAQLQPASSEPSLALVPAQAVYRPLEEVTVLGAGSGRLLVLDGDGAVYLERQVTLPVSFSTAGALGTHSILLLGADGKLVRKAGLIVDACTEIREPSGEFQHLLDTLYWTMASDGPMGARRHNGQVYSYWDDWLMDNTNTLKGMRYFWPEVRQSFEIFAVTQREDGMIWENHIDCTPPENDWERRFKYGDFFRKTDDGFLGLRRAPVENHVEAYFLEALYLVWKTTGDDAWMQQHLDRALHAVRYSTSDPYRWSTKFGLLKRGLTIDTWDFLCESEAALVGGDFMVVDLEKTHFGIFFGDNTGFIAGCRYLAEMLDHAERAQDARGMRGLADDLEQRLNRISWNGRFYTHWVPEDPAFRPDLGVDMSSQVSLSNAYSLNRGIAPEQARSIIHSYEAIRKQMPATSPGEFYSIYPPFPKGFGDEETLWDYVNGGVLACTAGELARGCFQHGYEQYGVDILRRLHEIAKRHRDFLPGILRGKQPERPPTRFLPLDLRDLANCDTGEGADGVPGWVGETNNFLVDFPFGAQTFRGVPFQIASGAENGSRVCIGVSSSPRYARNVVVPVHKACSAFYLLHASSGPGSTLGKLTIHYENGDKQIEYIERGVNVGSFWAPDDGEFNNRYGTNKPERMQVAWRGSSPLIHNVGVWITSFAPGNDSVPIATLELEAMEIGSRWFVAGITLSDMPAFLPPWSDISTGMPNNWGAGCVTAALLEGLCGIEDTGGGFRSARVSPHWLAGGVDQAEVSVRYPASRGYVLYRYRRSGKAIILDYTSCADKATLRVPLPQGSRLSRGLLNGQALDMQIEMVAATAYATVQVEGRGAHRLQIELA